MTDLSYSIAALEELGGELVAIVDVMNNVSPAVRYEQVEVGHRLVHDALEHFSDNWDDKRELLTGSLEAVAGMALQSADVLKEADDTLAAEIRKIMEADK